MPLDEQGNDDSDDEEDPPEPMETEESHLTTEESIPDAVVGQIFVRTLTSKTITANDVTTKTKIIDIKSIIDEKDGHPAKFQRLKYNGKKVKDNRTVGYYNIQRESELRVNGRLRGGGGKKVIKTIVKSKSTEDN